MMASEGGRVKGLDKLKARLAAVRKRITTSNEEALLELGEEMRTRMKAAVPVDTGTLRDSIKVEKKGGGITVGPRGVDYAGYVEFGTSRSPAQPYIRPVVQWARANAPKRFRKSVKGAISE